MAYHQWRSRLAAWCKRCRGAEDGSFVDMLDRLEKAHFNLVLFQVQANGDVLWIAP